MNVIKYVLFFVADIVLIGCAASFVYMGLYHPTRLAHLDTERTWRSEKYGMFKYLAWLTLAMIGIGICIYHGLAFLFSWMPHSWGTYDEEGEFQTWAEGLAGIGAFLGSLAIITGFVEAAHKFNKLNAENETLREPDVS